MKNKNVIIGSIIGLVMSSFFGAMILRELNKTNWDFTNMLKLISAIVIVIFAASAYHLVKNL